MAFAPSEKVKIRHHLGFLQVGDAQTFVLGIPAGVQTSFIIEGAMDRVLPDAEAEARRELGILDGIESQLLGDLELLAVEEIGGIKINAKELDKLRNEYQYWRRALANIFGVSPNPFDQRFAGGASGVNVPVGH